MDERGDGAGGSDDFPSEISGLADDVWKLAVKKRVEEINDDRGYQNGARSGQAGPPSGAQPLITSGDAEYKALEESYAWIPEVFEKFTRPNPADFEPMIDHFYPVLYTFGPDPGADSGSKSAGSKSSNESAPQGEPATGDTVMSEINAFGEVSNWDGDAGEKFEIFTKPFTMVKDNQREVARVLRRSMVANREIFVTSRKAVKKIAESTKKALADTGDFGGPWAAVSFSVAAAVLAVLGTAATGGALMPVALAAGSGVASIAGTFSSEVKDMSIAAHTVDDILQNMSDALTEVLKQIGDTEFAIANWLDENYKSITATGNRKLILAPRPSLANSNASNIKDVMKPPYE